MPKLLLAPELELPVEAVTSKFAFIARSGAGKTYGASKLAELFFSILAQVVIVDPVGVWWGLRLAANGKDKGLPIPVFGGLHGDLPLDPNAGTFIAQLIITKRISAVLDVSEFTGGELCRFVVAFATEFLRLKKQHRSPVHVFWDEAQDVVPQKVYREQARMVGAMERLIKQGRNFGVGTTLITQRPQAVAKDVLSQTEVLVVLQVNEAHARKAIEGWIVSKGLDVAELAGDLPALPRGDAYVWSPQLLGRTLKIHIAKKLTYDASSTPDFKSAKAVAPRELDTQEMAAIRAAMQETIAKAAQSDVKLLQRDNKELRAALDKLSAEKDKLIQQLKTRPVGAGKPVRVEVPIILPAHMKRAEVLYEKVMKFSDKYEALARDVGERVDMLLKRQPAQESSRTAVGLTFVERPSEQHTNLTAPTTPALRENANITGRMRDMLAVLRAHPGLTREGLAVRAVMNPTSGTFANYLGSLKAQGFIAQDDNKRWNWGLTGIPRSLFETLTLRYKSTAELVELWCSERLEGKQKEMLREVVERANHGQVDISRAELAAAVGMEPGSGTFANYLGALHTNNLVEKNGHMIRASQHLF
jgi:hypothetical protein